MTLGASYATTTQLKTRMSITVATYDTQLQNALDAASREIERHCDRQFNDAGSATARLYYADTIYTASVDDFSTTSGLVLATDDGGDGSFSTTWASTDYELEPLNGSVDGETGWPFFNIKAIGTRLFPVHRGRLIGRGAPVKLTARWGWTAVPVGVQEACLVGAEYLFKQKDAPFGIAGFDNYGPVRVRENPIFCSLLAPYRRYPVLVG